MHTEISHAVTFLCRFIPESAPVQPEQREAWKDALTTLLTRRFQGHWDVNQPMVGNAYRAITTFAGELDNVLVDAAEMAGLSRSLLASYLPRELVLWVDPFVVSYRIRDSNSTFALYEDKARCRALGMHKTVADFNVVSSSPTPVLIRPPTAPLSSPPQNRTSRSPAHSVSSLRNTTPSPQGLTDSASTSSTLSSPQTPPRFTTPQSQQQRLPPGLGYDKSASMSHTLQSGPPAFLGSGYPQPQRYDQLSSAANAYYLQPPPHSVTSQLYC
ncbi:hypothetical protein IWQ62_003959 [Dispira parvispora]|uniref:Anti-proliferative protein domain-containing protein n=1 Tax=Dispira parvispora TaxID=1520584 RepID=A0A9W8AQT4_9FUNG|nr:hypothetical protein IWQ62_003959 [Dispira parvispora]